jgi:hypothetical protein
MVFSINYVAVHQLDNNLYISVVDVVGIIQHCFNKAFHIKEVLNNPDTVMRVYSKAHFSIIPLTIPAIIANKTSPTMIAQNKLKYQLGASK